MDAPRNMGIERRFLTLPPGKKSITHSFLTFVLE